MRGMAILLKNVALGDDRGLDVLVDGETIGTTRSSAASGWRGSWP